MRSKLILSGVLGILFVASTHASVPPLMSYQGKLTDEYGVPVPDGNYTIWFRVYSDSIGSDSLWSELQWSVPVADGLFNTLLGSVNPIPETVFTGSVRWLGIQVSPDPEMAPRKPIVSVAYSLRAAQTDTADYV